MQARPPDANVVAHWPMNGTGLDTSPQNAPLAFGATPPTFGSSGPTDLGKAGTFTATTSPTVAAARPAYDVAQFTVDAWFRTTNPGSSSYPTIIQHQQSAPYRRNFILEFWHPSVGWGGLAHVATSVTVSGGTQRTLAFPSAALYDGQWHHVASVADEVDLHLYVDGIERSSIALGGAIDVLPGNAVSVGSAVTGGYPYVGDLDEVRVSNVASTAAQIRAYASARVPDYLAGTNDWSGVGSSLFGVCLRSATGASTIADWSATGACPTSNTPQWRAVPATAASAATVMHTTSAGATDPVARLRFGLRTAAAQAPGDYRAPLTIEAIAPFA